MMHNELYSLRQLVVFVRYWGILRLRHWYLYRHRHQVSLGSRFKKALRSKNRFETTVKALQENIPVTTPAGVCLGY
jgi:hypothetical protein